MTTFIALRCSFCKYIWCKRAKLTPVSCPRCKKRFDYPGSLVKLEEEEITSDSYSTMRDWLDDANRFSKKCKSLEDVCNAVEKL